MVPILGEGWSLLSCFLQIPVPVPDPCIRLPRRFCQAWDEPMGLPNGLITELLSHEAAISSSGRNVDTQG